MNKFKEILLYVWQLPQNLVGLLLLLFYKIVDGKKLTHYDTYEGVNFYSTPSMPSGISLGKYVIFDGKYRRTGDAFKHEFGHTRQSLKLGWLYLIVIGLPSLCGNIFDRMFHSDWSYAKSYNWYYSQPWEAWADKEGGIIRKY